MDFSTWTISNSFPLPDQRTTGLHLLGRVLGKSNDWTSLSNDHPSRSVPPKTSKTITAVQSVVDAIYGQRKQHDIPVVYAVEPPQTPKRSELDEARALVLAALRELPKIMLLVTALAVVGIRRCRLRLKQWRRTPKVD